MGTRPIAELLLRPTSRIAFTQTARRGAVPLRSTSRAISNPSTTQPTKFRPKENTVYKPDDRANSPTRSKPYVAAASSQAQAGRAIDDLMGSIAGPYTMSKSPRPSYTSDSQSKAARNVFGQGFLNNKPRVDFQRKGLDLNGMHWDQLDLPNQPIALESSQPEKQVFPRLNPAYGRTIELNDARGRDLVRGISMLGSLMARNRVRNDTIKQRFHERPGLKRKRLKSERWRARFLDGFQKLTARVDALTRKGW